MVMSYVALVLGGKDPPRHAALLVTAIMPAAQSPYGGPGAKPGRRRTARLAVAVRSLILRQSAEWPEVQGRGLQIADCRARPLASPAWLMIPNVRARPGGKS